ncbi:response regulator [Paenibacillus taichungensis]|uniref:response regulator transcription factor n=1 Tax=Paenibacillus taichungensis TaxID=484184 RepID=UPI0038CF7F9C
MCKLLIVEDELLIRTGLKHYFPWHELNVHEIYEAENGADGLKLAIEVEPDFIISDIRMPEMNGLEMIERLRPLLPDTVYLILTGYNDFEYARQAIQLGNVHDYLNKPLVYEESIQSVQSVLELVQLKKKERERRTFLEKEHRKWKESLFMKQLFDSMDDNEFPAEITVLSDQNHQDVMYLPMVMTNIAVYGKSPLPVQEWTNEVLGLIEKHIETIPITMEGVSTPILSYLNENKMYVIVACELENLNVKPIREHLQYMNLNQTHKTYFAIGFPSPSFQKMGQQLKQTEELLLSRYCLPECYYFSPEPDRVPLSVTTTGSKLDGMEKANLLTAFENKDIQSIRQLITGFSNHAKNLQVIVDSPHQWLAFLQELVSVILRYASRHHIPAAQIYSEDIVKLSFINKFQNAEQLFTWLADWSVQLISYTNEDVNLMENAKDSYVFSEIENFMKQHLDHDLSLQMVAERFFYNPSYLSRLFKTKLNKNYMTYVTELRIRHAQECLKDPGLLVSDVSHMCGYKSYKHFVKTFRSVTHMTPTHYRKRIGM